MAQNGGTRVNAGSRLNLISQLLGTDNTLGHDDDKVLLASDLGLAHTVEDVPFKVERDLRQQNGNRTGSDADVQGNITGMMAHDLNDRATVMALGGVAQLIDGLDSGIHSRIVADGVFAAGDVVIDGAGQADAGNALVSQRTGAHEGAVTADDVQLRRCPAPCRGKTLGCLPSS